MTPHQEYCKITVLIALKQAIERWYALAACGIYAWLTDLSYLLTAVSTPIFGSVTPYQF